MRWELLTVDCREKKEKIAGDSFQIRKLFLEECINTG